MLLVLILGLTAVLAIAVEVLNLVAREFLSGVRREDKLKAALREIEKDLVEAENKIGGLKANLRTGFNELDRVKNAVMETEKEIAKRQKVDPVLVYLAGSEVGTGWRFRAPVTKTLPEKPDPNQALLWTKKESFVEVWAQTEDQAAARALDLLAPKHGYKIGAFVRTGDEAMGKAA